jgi:tRNA G18 (ribose-2'-O)-methylase SpoU
MPPRHIRLFTENNDFQRAEVLRRNRQKRQRYGQFFVEGVRPINLALKGGWEIDSFYYAPERGLSDWAKDVLQRSSAKTHFEVPSQLLEKLSNKTETSELVAIVTMPEDNVARIPLGDNPLVVVFDRPASPGNLGTLIRSGDSLGADGLVITGHGADLYDPETISASRGSIFAFPTVRLPGPVELLPWLDRIRERAGSLQIVATDEAGTRDVWDQDFCLPSVILLGNEKWGLSAAYRDMADVVVRIPIRGAASSLNVAVAGSLILYEIERQRRSVVAKSESRPRPTRSSDDATSAD